MEKKTIGAFIAALRRANGMTQKELAERLNVSDKTVSRWERDDGAPDLSAIPAIAEIFGVSCDELLRGERKRADDPQSHAAPTARGEKERQRILKTTLSRYRDRTYIAMGVALVGFVVAMGVNLAFLKAALGFFLGLAFFVAAVVCQAVFTNGAIRALDDEEQSGEELGRLRYQVGIMAEKSYLLIVALLGFIAPLVLMELGVTIISGNYRMESVLFGYDLIGYQFSHMLLWGTPCMLIAVSAFLIVMFFRRNDKIRRGLYVLPEGEEERYHHNFALKKKAGVTLVWVLAGTLAFHAFGGEVLWSAQIIKRGTTFHDYDSFVAYMEEPITRGAQEQPFSVPAGYPAGWFSEGHLEDINGNTVCEYVQRNQEVTQVSYEQKDGTVLPITVYTYRNLEAARNLNQVITTIFFAVYPLEFLAAWLWYRRKRMK